MARTCSDIERQSDIPSRRSQPRSLQGKGGDNVYNGMGQSPGGNALAVMAKPAEQQTDDELTCNQRNQ